MMFADWSVQQLGLASKVKPNADAVDCLLWRLGSADAVPADADDA